MISEQDYKVAATLIGCEVAAIKAVAEVESKGSGFDSLGRIKILFEPHIFWKNLIFEGIAPGPYVKGNEDILYPDWKPGAYGPESIQYDRLKRAIAINEKAALMSASWGMFQIMGFNFKESGYPNIWAFQNALSLGEGEQLRAVSHLICTNNWDRALRLKDWEKFASQYNGSAYKQNKYDTKLQTAYNKYKNA